MIFRSPYPDIDLPNTAITPLVLRHVDSLADKPALIDATTGRKLTYRELRKAIGRAAAGLHAHGVRQGDVVAIFAPNCIEYMIAFHAIVSLGATVSTVNPMYLSNELSHQLLEHDARYLITDEDLLDRAEQAGDESRVRELFVIGNTSRHPSFDSLLAAEGSAPAVQIDAENDVAVLLCSSGTTGMPKAVMLTHRALAAIVTTIIAAAELSEYDVIPAHLPFFHILGVGSTMSAGPAAGLTSVILPRFDFSQFLQLIQDFRVTQTFAVPPILVQLAKNSTVDDYDLSSLRLITCGAAPLGADTEQQVRDRIGCQIKQLYGMTEIAPSHGSPNEAPPSKQGSVGVCLPNVQAMTIDLETGLPLGPGQTGEIWLRGPMAMKGYFNNPEATAATKVEGGWIRTGDLGYADDDGYFYIVDRLKELIKYKAYQVAPAELEAVLLSHPAVADCAVVRSPDEEAGEVPKAFVVLKAPATEEELIGYVAGRVAPYKKVRRLEFVDEIPKSATGKLLRRVLIERELERLREPSLI